MTEYPNWVQLFKCQFFRRGAYLGSSPLSLALSRQGRGKSVALALSRNSMLDARCLILGTDESCVRRKRGAGAKRLAFVSDI